MNKWKISTPENMQDYLQKECYNKRQIEEKLRATFFLAGYDEVETPMYEYLDVFLGEKPPLEQEEIIKIIETGNRILALRPDMTLPIARLTSTKLKNEPLPLKLAYFADIFRYYPSHNLGRSRQIPQAGIEFLGIKGPEADAEIIAMAIQCFLDLGLKDFQIDIGQVNFFKGLVEEANLDDLTKERLRFYIEQKNFSAIETLLKDAPLQPKLRSILLEIPHLYGDINKLKAIDSSITNTISRDALANIYNLYEILQDFGLTEYVTFDLGMVHSLDYYSGIIFKGFTKNLGYPICAGGRYDNLLKEFSYDIPATGFAIEIKHTLEALARQGNLKKKPGIDVLLVADSNCRPRCYELLKSIRQQGKRAEIFFTNTSSIDPSKYAEAKNISEIIMVNKKLEENQS